MPGSPWRIYHDCKGPRRGTLTGNPGRCQGAIETFTLRHRRTNARMEFLALVLALSVNFRPGVSDLKTSPLGDLGGFLRGLLW